ncbi:ABC transporter substrate-binding protein [Klebsiella pneumoniae]|nr:ABC transporter substrate-binding protein [Klebsiella pneumoniae]ELB7293606.1 ABC transporter substrate-binding protein [Klebsiella pneumoniae]MEA4238739.1 ABC transporter substrate-binding protein [Klebsiella pneumoniae]MEA4333339.1 ABC transporter substrate-binding protein [Klebsiella pneumoniae]MEA4390140.1 ABC transporter substrate-binding protein [Klebsiella pneumoniae]
MFKPFTLVAVGLSLALSGAALAKEKIDFMFPAPVDGKLTMEMTRVIKQFNDSQQDVEVRGIFTGNYDTTKIKAESAQKAGQPPALVIMSANFTTDLALKDEILPMDELFKYGDQKAGDFLHKEFWPAMHKNAQVMGTTYAIPFHNSTPILYYNKTMFDRAGIKQPPQTWAELLADAKKLTDESKGQWGIMLPSTNDDYGGWIFSALVRANGGKYFNEDYPGEVYYNSPTAIGALRFWQDLIYKDKVMPSGVLNSKQISAAFFSGKLGMAMLPAKEQRAVPIGGASLVSFKGINDAQKKAAYQFLTYLVSPEVNGAWSRFTGYFSPRKASYDTPEMKAYLQQDPRAAIALEQLKYAHPWYSTWETVAVRKAMENQLAAVVNDAKVTPEAAVQAAQKEADALMKPYVDKTALAEVK